VVADTSFYAQIPLIKNISEITIPDNYHDVPRSWYLGITDVRNSTEAVKNGRYKDVNAVAAACIAAVLNATQADIPFVFTGDGAAVVVPPESLDAMREALLATRELAAEHFDLDLRVGIIPVKDVLNAGRYLQVGRMEVSSNFQQAVFTGGGLTYADQIIKDDASSSLYIQSGRGPFQADFSGFECRWNQIPSAHGETVSLIVMATSEISMLRNATYREVLQQLDRLYGERVKRHPLTADKMSLAFNPQKLLQEAVFRYRNPSLWQRLKMVFISYFFGWAMRLNLSNWGIYKKLVIESTDNEKFDDAINMTISGSPLQRERLVAFLENRRSDGVLAYGIHASTSTLMTCVVYDYFGKQMHFIDGADGGYVYAAEQMKDQLSSIQTQTNNRS